ELNFCHDAEVALAAADRPEQFWVARGVDDAWLAVRADQVQRPHQVSREAVLAAEQTDPAAQRVADDADLGGRPGQWREAVDGRRVDDIAPPGASLSPRCAARWIDADRTHAVRSDQHSAVRRRDGAVPGRLDRHRQA